MNLDQALNIAMEHHQQGRLPEAEALYRQVLAAQPNQPDALHLLGMIALQVNRADVALDLIRRAIEVSPEVAQFHCNLGQALQMLGRAQEAMTSFGRALSIRPDYPEAAYNLGTALQQAGRHAEAISHLQTAVRLRPSHADALNNLGNALRVMGRLDEAVPCFERALKLRPDFAEAMNNLGNTHIYGGQVPDGIDRLRQAIAVQPDYASAHFNLGVALLLSGDLENGWPEYEWRWRTPEVISQTPAFRQPRWTGQSLEGKTLLLHAEQGFGDVIHFCRYAPLAAARGAKVVLQCQPQLQSVLRTLSGVESVIVAGDPLPPFDYHSPLLNLPRRFQTTLQTIPAATPYLFADAEKSARWRERMAGGKRKIGVAWSGNPGQGDNRLRSMSISMLSPLLESSSARWYSLQKQPSDQPRMTASGLIDWTDELQDFSDTAALMDNLDLVITVDTSVAHLAGALGKPVWTMLAFAPDWRWLLDRDDSPWYPTMRLFRQPVRGDWETPLMRVNQALRSFEEFGRA